MDDQWDQTVNCFRKKTGQLRDKVTIFQALSL